MTWAIRPGDTLYQCPSCGHQEELLASDWQECLPSCPVEIYDPVNDEMTGDAACPDALMVPLWGPGAT